MAEPRVPIPEHPGFWRRGKTVCFKYRDHRGKQRWASAPNVTLAKSKRAALQTDVARGEYRPQSRARFAEYSRACLRTYQGRTSKGIAEETRADYVRRLEQDAIVFFGDMRLTEIEPQDVKEFAAWVGERSRQWKRKKRDARPLSANSVRLALAPVKIVLATAFEEGVIRVNPAAGVRIATPKTRLPGLDDEDEGDVRALSEDELARLLDKMLADKVGRYWVLFFELLAQTGLRIGEAIELRWHDVDLGAERLKVSRKVYRGKVGRPKSRYGRRTIRLTPEMATALWKLRKETKGRDGDLVFVGRKGARVHASNLMGRVLKPAARAAGLGEWVGFHTFRHTCATALFREGKNVVQVQRWLGHHKPSFTIDTYVHLLPDDVPEAPNVTRGVRGGTSGGTQSARADSKSAVAGSRVKVG